MLHYRCPMRMTMRAATTVVKPWRTAYSCVFLALFQIIVEPLFASSFTTVVRHCHSSRSHCKTSKIQQQRLYSSSPENKDDIAYLEKVREGIAEAGLEQEWKDATDLLSKTLDIPTIQAEQSCAEIYNWKSWAVCTSKIAKKYIVTETPNASQIESSLHWLQSGPLQLSIEQLRESVPQTPKAYLLSPEFTYNQALQVAPEEYSSPEAFRDLLLQDPTVLECTYNCVEDGCASECGNCWVSFEARTAYKQQKM